jgi:beta-glucosidase-like glycosyl hydrolase
VVARVVVIGRSLDTKPRPLLTHGKVALVSPTPDTSPSATLQDDIGAVLAVSQSGTVISPTLRSMLVSGHVGGVLLFASNFKDAAGLRAWSEQLRALAATACLTHPILLRVDVRYSLPQATLLALAAGNDLVLLSNGDPIYEQSAMAAVRAAALSGRLSRSTLHDSAVRVNLLRDRWGLPFTHCRPALAR